MHKGSCGRRSSAIEFLDFVAIKILKPSLAYQPKRLAQFRREAERGLRFAGPSLLTTYEISSIDGYYFMVMPYVDGIYLARGHRGSARPRARRVDPRRSIP